MNKPVLPLIKQQSFGLVFRSNVDSTIIQSVRAQIFAGASAVPRITPIIGQVTRGVVRRLGYMGVELTQYDTM